MNRSVSVLVGRFFAWVAWPILASGLAQGNASTDVQFTRSAPHSSREEILRRCRASPPDYDLTQERFRMLVPEELSTNASWGLLVWISPGDHPSIPNDWKSALAKMRLLFIGAYNSGNARN